MNVFITGGNRGIGAGFVRHYLGRGDEVWACYRSDAGELAAIESERLHLLHWNIATDAAPHGELPATINLLINNAGIYGPGKDGQTLEKVMPETMLEVFNVDCIGPLRVVQQLRGRLAYGAVIANVSSQMGSIADNTSGGAYAYRAAKAALVMVSKSMALDLRGQDVQVITLHPGWVRTDMGGPGGLIDVETSVGGMAGVIGRAGHYDAGAFIDYTGKVVPY